MRTVEDLEKENDRLKFIIAKLNVPCIYCGLAKEDMNLCASGFPGCSRMDDMMLFLDELLEILGPPPDPVLNEEGKDDDLVITL